MTPSEARCFSTTILWWNGAFFTYKWGINLLLFVFVEQNHLMVQWWIFNYIHATLSSFPARPKE
jgi:hypothetical protein